MTEISHAVQASRPSFLLQARVLVLGMAVVAVLGGIGCAGVSSERNGDALMREARFPQALAAYRRAEAEGRSNPELQRKLRDAYVATRIQEGQQLLFRQELVKANELFQECVAVAPDSATAKAWLKKSERDLSRSLTELGKDKLSVREYQEAIELFESARRYDSGNEDAKAALDRAREILEWRARKGDELWRTGLRAGSQGQHGVAETRAENSLEFTGKNETVIEYVDEMRSRRGEEAYRLAHSMEEEGQWHGALRAYSEAKTLGSTAPGLDEAIARMEREAKADSNVRAGQLALLKEDFDEAIANFQSARELTEDPDNLVAIDARLAEVGESRNDYAYRKAGDLVLEGRMDDALAAFRALDASSPAYADTRERIDRLETKVIVPSRAAFAEAEERMAANDLEGARSRLKDVVLLYPFYPGARELLRKIEAKLSEATPR